jgi:hypothetical protein
MKNQMFVILTCIAIFGFVACQQKAQKEEPKNEDFELLKSYMTGSFSSQGQSETDTNFFDIRLYMAPIWNSGNDTAWLYVEQAASWNLDTPYRQRVYRLLQLDSNKFQSAIFTFNDPVRFTGDWQKENPLAELTPDSLTEKEGCDLILSKNGDIFEGSTVEGACYSDMRGASYATSEVIITKDMLMSLDRGWDSTHTQVWGSEYGAYEFKKIIETNNDSIQ